MERIPFACRICGNEKGNTTYTAREMMLGLRHQFSYIECAACKCLQIEKFPADMSPYYPNNYYSFKTFTGNKFKGLKGWFKKQQYHISVFPKGILNVLYPLISVKHYEIFKALHITRNTRILDVGCGNGRSFLYPLAEIGFKNIKGCDPFIHSDILYDNGLIIEKKSIAQIDGQWDIITWHHSFEHIAAPLEELQQAHKKLAPGGCCIIRIPTSSSYAWQHYKTNWAQLDAPRHYYLHSQQSMKILASKAGFKLDKVVYDSTHFQFSGSEKYLHNIALADATPKGIMRFVNRKFKKARYNQLAKKLNETGQGDQAAFFLVKE